MRKLKVQPFILAFTAFIVTGCATTQTTGTSAPRARAIGSPAAPAPQSMAGLKSVMGLNVAQLQHKFGIPRLDIREANGRKLQFDGKACILDVYLYAPDGRPANDKSEVVTHIDARRSDGAEVDRVACVNALSR